MLISIDHRTTYRYDVRVVYSIQNLRLTPRSFAGQTVRSWDVSSPQTESMTQSSDGFGNIIHLMTVAEPHDKIEIVARGIVEAEDRHGVVHGLNDRVPPRVYLRQTRLTVPSPGIVELAAHIDNPDRIAGMHALMAAIRERVDYESGITNNETTAAEALQAAKGVCQDHAHIFIAAARVHGTPARYVTGYLVVNDDGSAAHHAWAEAWIEGLGWVGFDVANMICPTDRYVRLAAALDAVYAAPVRGARRGGGEEKLQVEVSVAEHSQQ